ncbi:MAG: MFS transporter [Chloroflexi bacterium]|nr:MFS transporter [Chloroflexota bacterium]
MGRIKTLLHEYKLIVSAFFIMAVVWGTFYSFGALFKPISLEFGWTRVMMSGANALAVLTIGWLGIVMGKLADRFGPRIILTFCGLSFGLGHLLLSQITALWQLYLLYGVMIALGTSGTYAPLVSTVARSFRQKTGLMIGIVISGVGVGTVAVPPLVTQLLSSYGWRTSVGIVGLLAALLLPLAAQFLKYPSQVAGLPQSGVVGDLNKTVPAARASFTGRKTRQFWTLCAISFCSGFNIQVAIVHFIPHATDVGLSAAAAASSLTIIGALGIAGRLATGFASDKLGPRLSVSANFILLSIALLWLLLASKPWMLYLFPVIFGFPYGGLTLTGALIAPALFGLRELGALLGFISVGYFIGAAIGPVMAGYIFDATGRYQGVFLICVLLAMAGLALTLSLKTSARRA